MFITDRMVYVELSKTASTHLDNLFLYVFPNGQKIGKHNYPNNKLLLSKKIFVGSIKNPWEWYLSTWAYGCTAKERDGIYRKVTTFYPVKFKGHGFKKNKYLAFKSFVKQSIKSLFHDRKKWINVYSDLNNPYLFRKWMHMVFEKKNRFLINPIYDQSSFSSIIGLMSFKYLLLFCKNIQSLHSNKNIDYKSIEEFEKNNCYINFFIRCETLESDFFDVLDKNNVKLIQRQKDYILGLQKTNTTKRKRSIEYYYTNKLIEEVKKREKLIIDKFDYSSSYFFY